MSHFNVHEPKGMKAKLMKKADPGAFQQTAPPYKPPKQMPSLPAEQPASIIQQICIKGLHRIHCMALKTGDRFWFCPTFIKGNVLYGWRYSGNRWTFLAVHLQKVQSIQCL